MNNLYKRLGIKWECIRNNAGYRKTYDAYCLKLSELTKGIASEKKIQGFNNGQFEMFRQKYGLIYPVDYKISYLELIKKLKGNTQKILKKEQRDLIKDKEIWQKYLDSKYNINVLPSPKYKATIFHTLMSIMRNGLKIERSSSNRALLKRLIIGPSIITAEDKGSLMTITINLDFTLTEITNDIKQLLMCNRKQFKQERARLEADEDCLRIYNLKENEKKSYRDIMRMLKRDSGADHDRIRQLKRQCANAKKLIKVVTS